MRAAIMTKDNAYWPLPPWRRTDYCGTLRLSDEERAVVLFGWVAARRDHGRLLFIDLRDREGIVQLVFNPEHDAEAHRVAEQARPEYFLAVRGKVVHRPPATVNAQLATGEIEVAVTDAEILNASLPPPFAIAEEPGADEEKRLKYRYLDLRRPPMQSNLRRRHEALKIVREHLDGCGFVEIETPILFKSTPEGARDYLVPSRVNPGKFYALPQSPQLLKQILMVSGFDRYYQIARCFRDEDPRANRQPEFSQIDLEMTCPRPDDIIELVEGMLSEVFARLLGADVKPPFMRLSYKDALERFGTDKPDLRFELELRDLSESFAGTEFKIFADALGRGEAIYGLKLERGQQLTRRELDELSERFRAGQGLGLAWAKIAEDGWQGPIAKFVGEAQRERALAAAALQSGDTLLMMAGGRDQVRIALGELRLELASRFNLAKPGLWRFVWILNFPLFEYSQEERRLVSVHHPFTAPHPDDLGKLEHEPLSVRALAYDLVLNGQEMGGGSIRIHSRELQLKVLALLGFSREEAMDRFGFLIEALSFGAPPHGGVAFGVERLIMMLCGTDSLRDVMAFPKTQKAVDLMSGAPSTVEPAQLKELSIKVTT